MSEKTQEVKANSSIYELLTKAVERGNVELVKELHILYTEEVRNHARKQYYASMPKAVAEFADVKKNCQVNNGTFSYEYADLSGVLEAVKKPPVRRSAKGGLYAPFF